MTREGSEACTSLLESVGEGEKFASCSAAMDRLTSVRRDGWNKVQVVRQQLALAKRDERRICARNMKQGMKVLGHLDSIVKRSEKIADEVRSAFDGLLATIWIEEMLATRLDPLQDELSELQAMYERLVPTESTD